MVSHKWAPIAPAPGDFAYNFGEIDSLQRQWLAVKPHREAESPDAYRHFLVRFLDKRTRRWAVETGIIEGLYTLGRGVTETLVMRGISAELIEQSATNKDPRELARILHDHQDAMTYVYQQIREGCPITRSAIRQLHAALTQNQPKYRAVDQFGREFDATLQRGAFKKLPNKPSRLDGTVQEYCPPEQVDSELDNLLEWYGAYIRDTARYHPLLTAAWLHHRFTQIHPFADGNGRVVRALLSWHLVQQDYLPVVITRDDRTAYIASLECADAGNLAPFVDLLAGLQKKEILAVVGEDDAPAPNLVSQALDYIVDHIARQDNSHIAQLRSVNAVASRLAETLHTLLSQQAEVIRTRLQTAGRLVETSIGEGRLELGNGHWYHRHVVQTAKNSGHWANLNEARFYVKLSLMSLATVPYPRLVFVVSLHHTGRQQLTGIMVATAFALIGNLHPGVSETEEEQGDYSFVDCTPEPLTFTLESDADALTPRFKQWTEQCLAMALRQWGDYLS